MRPYVPTILALPVLAMVTYGGLVGPATKRPDLAAPTAAVVTQTLIRAASESEAIRVLDASQSTQLPPQTSQITFCLLSVQRIHLREAQTAVGFKPQTKCEQVVSSIRHKSKVSYLRALEWRQAGTEFFSSNTLSATLLTKNVAYRCRSARETQWRGTTLVTVVYRGARYYGVASTDPERLSCGPTVVRAG